VRFTVNHNTRQHIVDQVLRAEDGSFVDISDGDKRTASQNRKLWPMLNDIAKQCDYHGQRLDEEDWKDVFSASLDGELRMVPTLDNKRIVILGLRTSKMSKKRFSDLIELMHAYAAGKGVVWQDSAYAERLLNYARGGKW
jgi:hypothetical protein